MPGSSRITLKFERSLHTLKGMAFGLRVPTATTVISYAGPSPDDLSSLDVMMIDLIGESAAPASFFNADPTRALIERLCYLQALLQRQAKIPLVESFDVRELISDVTQKKQTKHYQLAMAYAEPQATAATLNWLLNVFKWWLQSDPSTKKMEPKLQETYEELQSFLRRYRRGGTNVLHFLDAAHVLQIPITHMVDDIYYFGFGEHSRLLKSSLTDSACAIGVALAKNKFNCAKVMRSFGIPVPRHYLATSEKRAVEIAHELDYPVVVKPADCDQGKGVFAGLKTDDAVCAAFKEAELLSKRILVEKHHAGEDYRLTVMNDKVIKIVHRRSGGVWGDGHSSVGDLVKRLQDTESSRRVFRRSGKHRLSLDFEAQDLLLEQGITAESIISNGKFVPLRRKANISSGGEYSVIPTSAVHPDNLELAIWAAQVLRLDIAGIDLITPDITSTWRDTETIICEVNAQPQIGFRDTPTVFQQILTGLLPSKGVIPIHLWISEYAIDEPSLPYLLQRSSQLGLQALAAGGFSWINEVRTASSFENTITAARALLCDQRVRSAVVVMTADEISRFGLPAPYFDSIEFLTDGSQDTMPSTLQSLIPMLAVYSKKIGTRVITEMSVHRDFIS